MVTSHGIARFCIPRRTTGLKAHLGGGDGGDNGGGGGGYAGGGGEGEGGGGGGLGEGDWPAIKAAAACKGYQGMTSQDWSFTVCQVVLSPFLTLATLAWVAYRLRYVLRT